MNEKENNQKKNISDLMLFGKKLSQEIDISNHYIFNSYILNKDILLLIIDSNGLINQISLYDLNKTININHPFQTINTQISFIIDNNKIKNLKNNFNLIEIKELKNGDIIIIENSVFLEIFKQISNNINLNGKKIHKFSFYQEIDLQTLITSYENKYTNIMEINNDYLLILGGKGNIEIFQKKQENQNHIYKYLRHIELNKNYFSLNGCELKDNLIAISDEYYLNFLKKQDFEKIKSIKLAKKIEGKTEIINFKNNTIILIDNYRCLVYLISVKFKEIIQIINEKLSLDSRIKLNYFSDGKTIELYCIKNSEKGMIIIKIDYNSDFSELIFSNKQEKKNLSLECYNINYYLILSLNRIFIFH